MWSAILLASLMLITSQMGFFISRLQKSQKCLALIACLQSPGRLLIGEHCRPRTLIRPAQ